MYLRLDLIFWLTSLLVSWHSLCIVSGIFIILSFLLLVSKDAQLSCRKGDKFFGSGFYYSGILNFHNIGDFLYISGNRFSYLVGLHMLYLYFFSTLSLQQTGLFFCLILWTFQWLSSCPRENLMTIYRCFIWFCLERKERCLSDIVFGNGCFNSFCFVN